MHIAKSASTSSVKSILTSCHKVSRERLDEKDGAVNQLDYLVSECERAGQKMYLFIDEYDHFTNAILSDAESLHRYTDETHGEGYLRAFLQ